MMTKLKTLTQKISNVNVTVTGGFALLFFSWWIIIIGLFLIDFIKLNVLLLTGDLPMTDRGQLGLNYITVLLFIWIIKHSTITKNKPND